MYCKVLKDDLIHYNFTYTLGLNIDPMPFNPSGSCESGGLYYTTIDNIAYYINVGTKLGFVSIPEDAQVYKDPEGNDKWKADKIIIDKIIELRDFEGWNDEKYCMDAVKKNGYCLQYVKNQIPDICLEAVRQDGYILKYVEKQTPELCMEAVKSSGGSLKYVLEQTPELCMEAVKHDGCALQYVKNQTIELCRKAVKEDESAVRYINEWILKIYIKENNMIEPKTLSYDTS
jgi:hypothetical protein